MTTSVLNELQNIILGGDFNINPWQRGTSFVSPTSGDYTADRFQYRNSGTQDYTIRRSATSPTHAQCGVEDTSSYEVEVTTANASPGPAEFTTIEQPIEGFLAAPIYNNMFSISFWVYSSVAGTYCMAFQDASRSRNYIVEYTISAPTTWERITFEVAHDASVGTWNIDNQAGLRVIFTLVAGTNFQGSADSWQASDLIATSNQVNFAASLTNTFRIALARSIRSSVGDAFYMRDRGRELMLCQRYYEKSYNTDVDPGTVTAVGEISAKQANDTNIRNLQSPFAVPKRTTPTMTWYSPSTGASANIHRYSGPADHSVTSTNSEGSKSTGYPTISGGAVGTDWGAHYVADAEL